MRIFIGSDHAGFELKEKLVTFLQLLNHEVKDMGAYEYNKDDDYSDFIKPVAKAVAGENGTRGIILGASGQGEAICANRVRGVRAGVYYGGSIEVVKKMREHNDSNILSLGARFLNEQEARDAVKLWLATPFSGEERHVRRIAKLDS